MILVGQPSTEALSIDETTLKYGQYVLGNLNGYVVLKNMSLGDSVEVNYGQIDYNQVLVFDQNWSRTALKNYSFTLNCIDDLFRAKRVLYADHALITRLLCKGEPNTNTDINDPPWDWVEYGFIDPSNTRIINSTHVATIELSFITVFEVSRRKQLQCPYRL